MSTQPSEAMAELLIRAERGADVTTIRKVVRAAFASVARSNQKEHLLVDRLRESGALAVTLVAEVEGRVVGHVACSPVTIAGRFCDCTDWHRWRYSRVIREPASARVW